MSLVGSLEDLGLGDILQIVSLSRKSGVLTLASRNRNGKIFFLNGQVIHATSNVFPENLGSLLVRKGVVSADTLKRVLDIQRRQTEPALLGKLLAEHCGVQREAVEAVAKRQIERIVYSFFGWTEGTFSFELEAPDKLTDCRFSPLKLMLEQGLNTQWLAIEGSRLLDEQRHQGGAIDPPDAAEAFASDRGNDSEDAPADVAEESVLPDHSHCQVLLVDDEPVARTALGRFLRSRGYGVELFGSGDDFIPAVDRAVAAGIDPVLVIDLIMPRRDGTGVLGGMEILEEVRDRHPFLSVLMVSEHPNPETELKIQQLGVRFLLSKPKKSEFGDSSGLPLLNALDEAIASISSDPSSADLPGLSLFNLGAELLREIGEPESELKGVDFRRTPALQKLKGILQELCDPSHSAGVILLALRFASEFMNRAVIFSVKEKEIVGLGQFGIEFDNRNADALIRNLSIPRDQDSILSRVVRARNPLRVRFGDGETDRYLLEHLGGVDPGEVFLGPLISEGNVVAILYGDNLPGEKAIGDTESLEIFLAQAGMAMEKALLERRLKEQVVV